ncbi:MAG: ATP-dependent RNA helicase HrpA [Deltaproteobacteria bacterium]|nr:ATP-dependent RNA helicase HrpA [Deltaproteobacteria bacterium]MBW2661472.1 ATP-dependent RNA helicase HrpA [Deltaproteobacteria bacterium]
MKNDRIKKIESLLPKVLCADRQAVRREILLIKRSKAKALSDEKLNEKILRLEKQIQASIKKKSWRKQNTPGLTYNPDLPITDKKNEIIDLISKNQVLIISGETGSGKTTQIPKFCIAAGRGIDGKIGCTQPRRIAATTVARRLSEELGEELGKSVGYKIRFKNETGKDAFIKIMTDGILLAEAQNDKYLNEYDTIIVDEAHERSLNIDFIIGILKTLLKKRKDLKIIITSATIDTEKFSKAFDNAPVIEVSGRMYPIEVQYFTMEQEAEPEGSDERTHIEMAALAVDKLQEKSPYGDIIVFMPTEQGIRETCEILEGRNYKSAIVLPLYARLSSIEQSRVFSRLPGRKIIVATNIAETSITIPGIKYVIDTGLARISRYTPRSRTTSLPVVPISRSSADQRKGRCGRVENGICIRLFSEQDFLSRRLFTPPEILRANLAEVILRMISLKLGNIEDFPFIDRPAERSIRDGFDLLLELGAISPVKKAGKSKKGNTFLLTEKGRLMARMPIDPRLSRMLIKADQEQCLNEVVVIASALSIQDPRERPVEKAQEADEAQALFRDPLSDFITLLNIWKKYHDAWKKVKSTNKMKKFCKKHYLSFKRIREWRDIHAQIFAILQESGVRGNGSGIGEQGAGKLDNSKQEFYSKQYEAIHKSILSGFLSNIAVRKEKNIFQAAKGKEVMIFPGSGLFNKAKTWIVAAEMVETSRLFARTAANIDNRWLESLGKDQCKYTYLKPHWERNRGEVTAYEQVSLYGLIIVSERPVSYGRINLEEASEIFIRRALVEGDIRETFPFMEHNKKLIDEISSMENRLRKRDILISDEDIFAFYQKRLKEIYDIRTLKKRLKEKGADRFLRMEKNDLLRYLPDEEELSLFPEDITLGTHKFKCNYNFKPGSLDDGITIKVPEALAATVPAESVEWIAPGLYRDKITALIKGLPKNYRKQLVPVTNTVDIIVKEMPGESTSLITALSKFIYKRFGKDIPASAWSEAQLPDHLKMRISITDPKGEVLCSGRSKTILSRSISSKTDQYKSDEFESAKKEREIINIKKWDFEDLPDAITITGKHGAKLIVYPGLELEKKGNKSINLQLFQKRDEAVRSHKKGVAALFTMHFSKDLKFLKKNLSLPKEKKNMVDYFGGPKIFEQRMYESIIKKLFCRNIRTKDAFYSHAKSLSPTILKKGLELLNQVMPVLKAYYETRLSIFNLEKANKPGSNLVQFYNGLRNDLSKLVPETFMDLYDNEKLTHIARYVKAIAIRAQRASINFEKDELKAKKLEIYIVRLNEMLKNLSSSVSEEKKQEIEKYFWLIEEYKVSIFAQELKTSCPVSEKRLDKKIKEIERMV